MRTNIQQQPIELEPLYAALDLLPDAVLIADDDARYVFVRHEPSGCRSYRALRLLVSQHLDSLRLYVHE